MISNDLALAFVVLKVMGEQIKTGKAVADREVLASAQPEDRTSAVLPDGTKVGTVNLNNGRLSAKVTDREAFTAWVQAEHPTEVVMTPAVRPAFEKRVLDQCKANKFPADANGDEVPGIEVSQGDPYPMVKVADDADGAVAAAYQAGELTALMARFTQPAAVEAGAL